jgi:hypothetical protein
MSAVTDKAEARSRPAEPRCESESPAGLSKRQEKKRAKQQQYTLYYKALQGL